MVSVGLEIITEEQLKEALSEQVDDELFQKPHRNIGKILIDKGLISYNQVSEILDKIKGIEHNKSPIIKAIQKNIRILNSIVLLVLFTIFFLIIKIVSTVLEYIPSFTILILLAIMSGLVVIGFYFTRKFTLDAINNLVEYSNKMDVLLITLEHKIAQQRQVDEKGRETIG
ncbi:MAG: hypothetical protein KAI96_06910 [Thermodesulfovibrionia bacterium]|jgi:hypothetical protein|nr:hypothetical protein [Thermodesulfovibrionia bacterium]